MPLSGFAESNPRFTEKFDLTPGEEASEKRPFASHDISKDLIAIQNSNKQLLKKLQSSKHPAAFPGVQKQNLQLRVSDRSSNFDLPTPVSRASEFFRQKAQTTKNAGKSLNPNKSSVFDGPFNHPRYELAE